MAVNFIREASVRVIHVDGSIDVFSGFRIMFEIKMTETDEVDLSEVTIYNLTPSRTNSFLEGDRVELYVNYRGRPPELLTAADLAYAVVKKDGPTFRTTLELTELSLQKTPLAFARKGRYPLRQAIEDIAEMTGLSVHEEEAELLLPDAELTDWSVAGRGVDLLDDLLSPYGIKAKERRGILRLHQNERVSTYEVLTVSEETGMISSPVNVAGGCRIKVVLNVHAVPGLIIDVQSRFSTGTFKLAKVVHRGDTGRGQEWETELYCPHLAEEPEFFTPSSPFPGSFEGVPRFRPGEGLPKGLDPGKAQ